MGISTIGGNATLRTAWAELLSTRSASPRGHFQYSGIGERQIDLATDRGALAPHLRQRCAQVHDQRIDHPVGCVHVASVERLHLVERTEEEFRLDARTQDCQARFHHRPRHFEPFELGNAGLRGQHRVAFAHQVVEREAECHRRPLQPMNISRLASEETMCAWMV